MIDWNRISELHEEIGEDDFHEIVELFLEEVEDALTRLDNSDSAALSADLHYLKGSSLNLGFESLADLCKAGEAAISAGLPVNVSDFSATFHKAREVFALGISQDLAAS